MPSNFEIAFFNIAVVLPPAAVLVGLISLLIPRRKAEPTADTYRHAA